jgi:hypothetical protein
MLCAVRTYMALLSLLVTVAATAGGPLTYRWVDADGVHYSDQPHPGAEQITLAEPQTYSGGHYEVSSGTSSVTHAAREPKDSGEFRYSSCAVIQPAQDQVLIDVASATVAVQVEPAKRGSDRVVLTMDGTAIEPQNNGQMEFVISPVDRGTHIVAATVRDAAGNTVCQSAALTFHVRQPTVRRPVVTPH